MKGLRPVGMVEPMSLWTLSNISHLLHLTDITVHLLLFHTSRRPVVFPPQNLWFANPGGSNSMPSRSHSSVQRTRSLPVHTSPQTMLMFQQPGRKQTFFFFIIHTSKGTSVRGVEAAAEVPLVRARGGAKRGQSLTL